MSVWIPDRLHDRRMWRSFIQPYCQRVSGLKMERKEVVDLEGEDSRKSSEFCKVQQSSTLVDASQPWSRESMPINSEDVFFSFQDSWRKLVTERQTIPDFSATRDDRDGGDDNQNSPRQAKLQSNHHQYTNTQLLQAACPSFRPTNTVKALKATDTQISVLNFTHVLSGAMQVVSPNSNLYLCCFKTQTFNGNIFLDFSWCFPGPSIFPEYFRDTDIWNSRTVTGLHEPTMFTHVKVR